MAQAQHGATSFSCSNNSSRTAWSVVSVDGAHVSNLCIGQALRSFETFLHVVPAYSSA